ncbi:MAG: O-antigen ligase family protein [Lachnospiraceae bacterium]|nr:O-antigen ligase family protein [Lachnospiraceae bacterium]
MYTNKKNIDILQMKIAAFFLALYIIYSSFFEHAIGKGISFFFLIISTIIVILIIFKEKTISFSRKGIGWWIILLFALYHNGFLLYSDFGTFFYFAYFLFIMVFAEKHTDFVLYFFRFAMYLSLLSAIVAVLCYFYPSLYSVIFSIYDGFVANTDGGNYGYRAGLMPHTSWQGIVCSMGILYDGTILILQNKRENYKKNIIRLVRALVFLFALILSAKRGPLLFVVMVLLILYLFINRGKSFQKIIFLTMIGTFFLISFEYLVKILPGLSYMMGRFTNTNDISSLRFQFWKLALEQFYSHPFLGIGWLKYRYVFSKELFPYLNINRNFLYTDVHNVYIQILCETGIFGIIIYITTIYQAFMCSVRKVRISEKKQIISNKDKINILCLGIQVFYLLYSLTGNPLYDFTFIFYALSCGLAYSKMEYE